MRKRTLNYTALSKQCGVPAHIISQRVNVCHWCVKQAMYTPYKKAKRNASNQFTPPPLKPYGVTCTLPFKPNMNCDRVGLWA